jgi:hypothetical protein
MEQGQRNLDKDIARFLQKPVTREALENVSDTARRGTVHARLHALAALPKRHVDFIPVINEADDLIRRQEVVDTNERRLADAPDYRTMNDMAARPEDMARLVHPRPKEGYNAVFNFEDGKRTRPDTPPRLKKRRRPEAVFL